MGSCCPGAFTRRGAMGGSQSSDAPPEAQTVDHAGFSDPEYAVLRKRLGVAEDVPGARVELKAFLEHFNPHMRPLVQPVFARLGREIIGETSASWPVFVSNLSRLISRGISWDTLLKIWSPAVGEPGGSGAGGVDTKLSIELAASLCFWCAHPTLKPTASAENGAED